MKGIIRLIFDDDILCDICKSELNVGDIVLRGESQSDSYIDTNTCAACIKSAYEKIREIENA